MPYGGRFYGCMVVADYHANRFISATSDVSIRFVAEETGAIKSFRWQCRHDGPPPVVHTPATGHHSDGWGGNVTATLRRDLGDGTPDMSSAGVIAQTRVNNGSSTPLVLSPQETTWQFISPGLVTCGRTYHVVFRNSHRTDRVSVNANYNWTPIPDVDPSSVNGPYYRSDWSLLVRNLCLTCPDVQYPAVWRDLRGMPWITMTYTSGITTGCAEDWSDNSSFRQINDTQWVRQAFTVRNHSFVADSLWFRLWSDNGLGELSIWLEDSSGVRLFETGLPAGIVPVGDRKLIAVPWTRIDFGQYVELVRDQSYRLVIAAPGGACRITAIRDGGVHHGYRSRNRWLSSMAQFSNDAGATWSNWVIPNQSSKTRIDMMMPLGFGLVTS